MFAADTLNSRCTRNWCDVNNRILFCWSSLSSGFQRSKLAIGEVFLESSVVLFVGVVAGVLTRTAVS